jgi:chlorobactene glucosyltransferase
MIFLMLLITGILLIFSLTLAMNLLLFPRLKAQKAKNLPFVSILIPARNEASIIELTIRNILSQTFSNFELIILDDNSEDNTAEIVSGFLDPRLKLLNGESLPENWIGKPWACWQLAQAAKGEFLIFTDADVQWQAPALESIVAELEASQVAMLTVWPSQITKTWPERLTVPLIALVILAYLPIVMVHHSPFSLFAAANGQCMAWKREVYFRLTGHQLVAKNVLDDVRMARAAKAAGFRIRSLDGNQQIATRMYQDWTTVRDGFAKNILAGYGNVPALLAATVLHIVVFLVPYLLLFTPEYQLWAAMLILMGISLRAVSAWFSHQRVLDSLFMPISVLLMTVIALQSIYWHFTGTAVWKGRKLNQKENSWRKASS